MKRGKAAAGNVVSPLRLFPCRGSGFRRKERGMELQVSFLVVLIISIVIFGSGLFLVRKFFAATSAFQEKIDANTAKEIERRLAESGEKVAIPINLKAISVGETKVFGLGILNALDPVTRCSVGGESKPCNKLGVVVKFVTAVDAKTQTTNPETESAEDEDIERMWVQSSFPPVELTPNQLKVISIPVRVANVMKENPAISTRRNTIFIFNVCVFKQFQDTQNSGLTVQCKHPSFNFADSRLYGGRALKMMVQVP